MPLTESDFEFSREERRRIRREALEQAARAVEATRMPHRGDGPVLLLDVLTAASAAVRRLK